MTQWLCNFISLLVLPPCTVGRTLCLHVVRAVAKRLKKEGCPIKSAETYIKISQQHRCFADNSFSAGVYATVVPEGSFLGENVSRSFELGVFLQFHTNFNLLSIPYTVTRIDVFRRACMVNFFVVLKFLIIRWFHVIFIQSFIFDVRMHCG